MFDCFKQSRWSVCGRPFPPRNEIAADMAAATAEKFASNETATKNCADMILRILLGGLLAVSVVRAQSADNRDQAALIALENGAGGSAAALSYIYR